MLCLWSGPLGFNCWISAAPAFHKGSCCWVLILFQLSVVGSWFIWLLFWCIDELEVLHTDRIPCLFLNHPLGPKMSMHRKLCLIPIKITETWTIRQKWQYVLVLIWKCISSTIVCLSTSLSNPHYSCTTSMGRTYIESPIVSPHLQRYQNLNHVNPPQCNREMKV